jgi:hypothetical protein
MTPVSPVGGEVDVARLREVAEAATPGPWESNVLGSEGYEVRGPDVPHKPTSSVMRRPRVARCGYEGWDIDKANAEHIATFDPPTVLALLARLDAAEAARDEALAALEAGDACGAVGCRALAERDEALAAVERVRALADEWHNWATWEGSAGHRIRAALTPSAPTEEEQ